MDRSREVNCVMFRISFRQIVTGNYVHSTKALLLHQIQGSVATESLNLTTECLQTFEALQSFGSPLPPIVNYNAQNSSCVVKHEFHINYISRCSR